MTSKIKNIILAALPKPPEGKVWRQYKGKQIIGEGRFIVVHDGAVTLNQPNRGVIGDRADQLFDGQSSWYLVNAPKEKVIYCRPKMSSPNWTAKMQGDKHIVYSSYGQKYKVFEGSTGKEYNKIAIKDLGSESGYVEITRDEFLALIKSLGLNEDGTKAAPPAPVPAPEVKYVVSASLGTFADCAFLRVNLDGSATRVLKDGREFKYEFTSSIESCIKDGSWKYITQAQALALLPRKVRYFTHRTRFGDGTAYLRHDGDPSKNLALVRKNGTETVHSWFSLDYCEKALKEGWKEITESEAKALVTPPKTELELVKEKLAAAEARIKVLDAANSELARKIASAKATLS